MRGNGRLGAGRRRRWLGAASRGGHDHAAAKVVDGEAGQVDGGAASGDRDLDLLSVGLQAADAGAQASGQDFDLLPDVQRAVDKSARGDGAEAGHGKDAVDWKPRAANVAAGRGPFELRLDRGEQVVEPQARHAGDGDNGEPSSEVPARTSSTSAWRAR